MGRVRWLHLAAAGVAFVCIVSFALAGGTQALGAHPRWANKVGYIGAGFGGAIWLACILLSFNNRRVLFVASIAFGVAALATWLGKSRFVASFAEDTLAGRFWFYGWIALMAATFTFIAALAATILGRRR